MLLGKETKPVWDAQLRFLAFCFILATTEQDKDLSLFGTLMPKTHTAFRAVGFGKAPFEFSNYQRKSPLDVSLFMEDDAISYFRCILSCHTKPCSLRTFDRVS